MRKACIFDLDGTLAFTLDSMATVANQVLTELGLRELPTEKFKYYCGDGADMLVRRCLEDAGDPQLDHYEEARKMYRERFDQDPLYKVSVYPHMMEALNALKEAGVNTSHVKILQEVRTGNAIILNPSPMNEKIMELPLDQIDYFLLNEIEAMQILQMEEPEEINGKCIAGLLHEKFPNATIVLTLGGDISNHI